MKRTVVIGASTKPERYSYKAVVDLMEKDIEVFPIGIKEGQINGLDIITNLPKIANVDTITLYLNPKRQKDLYDYILDIKPKRLIFNPGTENLELFILAKEAGIEVEEACTLVMLRTEQY